METNNPEIKEENTEQTTDTAAPEESAVNHMDDLSEDQFKILLKNTSDMMAIMDENWKVTQDEFKLTDSHMKELYQFNETHRTPMPDNLSEEERKKWDHFNGLDNISEEDILRIFGEGHPIIGIEHNVTVDRVKEAISDFMNWLAARRQYQDIYDSYLNLIETKEDANMVELVKIMEDEKDPEKKAAMKTSIDLYYYKKYLGFLADPMDEKEINRLVAAYNSKEKIQYYLERSKDKLRQIGVSSKIILEISQFENRFLPEKYHKLSNILLLHFMSLVTYSNVSNKDDENKIRVIFMTIAFDNVIRNVWKDDTRNKVLDNIMKFEDQFIDKIG